MSLVRLPPAVPRPAPTDDGIAPRRGRPPARNEILRAGRLGGLAPEELATRFGTPLYVYDLDVIDRQVESLRAVLPAVVDLAYAVKANPALAVVAHLGRLGLGADVASGGELATAIRAGIDPVRIVMTGNAGLEAAIALVNEAGLFRFLRKPVPLKTLQSTAADALKQYRLVTAERDILERTLAGMVKVLAEILSTVDPETFKIVNGKLYLFYNRFFNNTLTNWNKDEANLKTKADVNWQKTFY